MIISELGTCFFELFFHVGHKLLVNDKKVVFSDLVQELFEVGPITLLDSGW